MIRNCEDTMRKSLWMLICIPLFLLVFIMAFPANVRAAAGYKHTPYNTPTKVGKYYIKPMENSVWYSKKKNSGYISAELGGINADVYSDGTYIITIERTTEGSLRLVRVTLKSGKVKVLKKLPTGNYKYEPPYWDVSCIYNDFVYVTRGSFEDWNYITYAYDLNAKKFRKIKEDCKIVAEKGAYAVAATTFQTDVSAHPYMIYKFSSNGKLKQVKKLGDFIGNATIVGKKVYYNKYTDTQMKKLTICRCNLNGKNVEKLGSFKTTQQYGQVMAYNMTSKDCTVHVDGQQYTYTFKNKKLTPLVN